MPRINSTAEAGYFLLLLAALVEYSFSHHNYLVQVLLSPPIVVYSPRVLPVYVYDAHADCGENVRFVYVSSRVHIYYILMNIKFVYDYL